MIKDNSIGQVIYTASPSTVLAIALYAWSNLLASSVIFGSGAVGKFALAHVFTHSQARSIVRICTCGSSIIVTSPREELYHWTDNKKRSSKIKVTLQIAKLDEKVEQIKERF